MDDRKYERTLNIVWLTLFLLPLACSTEFTSDPCRENRAIYLNWNGTHPLQTSHTITMQWPDEGKFNLFLFGRDVDFTMEFWVLVGHNVTGNSSVLMSNKDWSRPRSSGFHVMILEDGEHLLWNVADGIRQVNLMARTLVADGRWHHVATTFRSRTQMELYVDGNLTNATAINGIWNFNSGLPLVLGNDGKLSQPTPFWGAFDEVRIWQEARSARLIEKMKDVPLRGKDDNLVSYYPFTYILSRDKDGALQYISPDSGLAGSPAELSNGVSIPETWQFGPPSLIQTCSATPSASLTMSSTPSIETSLTASDSLTEPTPTFSLEPSPTLLPKLSPTLSASYSPTASLSPTLPWKFTATSTESITPSLSFTPTLSWSPSTSQSLSFTPSLTAEPTVTKAPECPSLFCSGHGCALRNSCFCYQDNIHGFWQSSNSGKCDICVPGWRGDNCSIVDGGFSLSMGTQVLTFDITAQTHIFQALTDIMNLPLSAFGLLDVTVKRASNANRRWATLSNNSIFYDLTMKAHYVGVSSLFYRDQLLNILRQQPAALAPLDIVQMGIWSDNGDVSWQNVGPGAVPTPCTKPSQSLSIGVIAALVALSVALFVALVLLVLACWPRHRSQRVVPEPQETTNVSHDGPSAPPPANEPHILAYPMTPEQRRRQSLNAAVHALADAAPMSSIPTAPSFEVDLAKVVELLQKAMAAHDGPIHKTIEYDWMGQQPGISIEEGGESRSADSPPGWDWRQLFPEVTSPEVRYTLQLRRQLEGVQCHLTAASDLPEPVPFQSLQLAEDMLREHLLAEETKLYAHLLDVCADIQAVLQDMDRKRSMLLIDIEMAAAKAETEKPAPWHCAPDPDAPGFEAHLRSTLSDVVTLVQLLRGHGPCDMPVKGYSILLPTPIESSASAPVTKIHFQNGGSMDMNLSYAEPFDWKQMFQEPAASDLRYTLCLRAEDEGIFCSLLPQPTDILANLIIDCETMGRTLIGDQVEDFQRTFFEVFAFLSDVQREQTKAALHEAKSEDATACDHDESKAKLEKVQHCAQELEQQLQAEVELRMKAQTDFEKEHAALLQLQAEIEKWKSAVQELQVESRSKQEEMERLNKQLQQAEVEKWQSAVQELQGELKTRQEETERLNEQLQALREEAERRQSESQKMQLALAEEHKAADEFQAAMRKQEAEMQALQSKLDAEMQQLHSQMQVQASLQAELKSKSAEVQQLRAELHKTRADAEHFQAEVQQQNAELQKQRAKVEQLRARLQAQTQLEAEIQALKAQLEQSQAELQAKTQQCQEVESKVKAVNSEVGSHAVPMKSNTSHARLKPELKDAATTCGPPIVPTSGPQPEETYAQLPTNIPPVELEARVAHLRKRWEEEGEENLRLTEQLASSSQKLLDVCIELQQERTARSQGAHDAASPDAMMSPGMANRLERDQLLVDLATEVAQLRGWLKEQKEARLTVQAELFKAQADLARHFKANVEKHSEGNEQATKLTADLAAASWTAMKLNAERDMLQSKLSEACNEIAQLRRRLGLDMIDALDRFAASSHDIDLRFDMRQTALEEEKLLRLRFERELVRILQRSSGIGDPSTTGEISIHDSQSGALQQQLLRAMAEIDLLTQSYEQERLHCQQAEARLTVLSLERQTLAMQKADLEIQLALAQESLRSYGRMSPQEV